MGIKESRFNQVLRRELEKYGFKIDRIESHATAPGIPDNTFVHEATRLSGWMEVKEEEDLPKRVKYRPKQPLWHRRHHRAGGNVMTIIHIKSSKCVVIVPGDKSFEAEKNLHALIDDGIALSFFISPGHEEVGWGAIARAIIFECRHTRRKW